MILIVIQCRPKNHLLLRCSLESLYCISNSCLRMARFRQILVALAVIQWSEDVTCAPLLQGVKITRNFGIDFKPFPFRPFSYIREKWGPFGAFGKKHAITKRETLDTFGTVNITPPPYLPTGSIVPQKTNTAILPPPIGPAFGSPAPVFEVRADNPPPPVSIPPIPSGTPPTIANEIPQGNQFLPDIRSILNLPGENIPTGLSTDIFRGLPIRNPNVTPVIDNTPYRVTIIPPSLPPINPQPPVNPQVPGTPAAGGAGPLARMFGEFILQLLSRLITNARSSFSRLSPSQ